MEIKDNIRQEKHKLKKKIVSQFSGTNKCITGHCPSKHSTKASYA
jgi:hypothetical protein